MISPIQYHDYLTIHATESGGLAYYDPSRELYYGGMLAPMIAKGKMFGNETENYKKCFPVFFEPNPQKP